MRIDLLPAVCVATLACPGLLAACGPMIPGVDTEDASASGTTDSLPPITTSTTTVGPTTVEPDETTASVPVTDEGVDGLDLPMPPPGCAPDCPDHPLDVLFVIDNTRTMGPGQLRLATAVQDLMSQLQALELARGVTLDLQLMVTTVDFGNPLCTPFEPAGYEPARGAPVATACTERLQDFTDLTGTITFTEACTDVCPVGVAPTEPFVHVAGTETNVPGGDAVQALQCLLPQGLVGCGFESPLENMLQALNPSAAWNQGPTPFVRDGADLAIVLLTDELDCSIQDFSVMNDPAYQETNPDTGTPAATSALCWNAGVTCSGPDGMGTYQGCTPVDDGPLQEVARYTSYLVQELVGNQGKEIMMLALVGVPPVTSHAGRPPYEPTAGGIDELVVRDWIDSPYPAGDIDPDAWAMGIDAADQEFTFGIGPGCTARGGASGHFVQGLPPIRIQAACEALDAQGGPHCCIESICDEDYGGAMTCLRGMIETSL